MVYTSDTEQLDAILLSMVEGIGSRTYQRLLKQFGNASAILDASRSDLANVEFLKPETLEQLTTARKKLDPAKIWDICESHQIDIISLQDSRYPQQLLTISDPPPILYIQGTLLPSDAFSIAVIGTRHCTAYGMRQADRLTSALVQKGIAIVSGLARGIDSIAHQTALLLADVH